MVIPYEWSANKDFSFHFSLADYHSRDHRHQRRLLTAQKKDRKIIKNIFFVFLLPQPAAIRKVIGFSLICLLARRQGTGTGTSLSIIWTSRRCSKRILSSRILEPLVDINNRGIIPNKMMDPRFPLLLSVSSLIEFY